MTWLFYVHDLPVVQVGGGVERTIPTGALDITGYAPTLQQCRQYLCDAYASAVGGVGGLADIALYEYQDGGATPNVGDTITDSVSGLDLVLSGEVDKDNPEWPSPIDFCTGYMYYSFWDQVGSSSTHLWTGTGPAPTGDGVTIGGIFTVGGFAAVLEVRFKRGASYERFVMTPEGSKVNTSWPNFNGAYTPDILTSNVHAIHMVYTASAQTIEIYVDGLLAHTWTAANGVDNETLEEIIYVRVAARQSASARAYITISGRPWGESDWEIIRDAYARNFVGYLDPNCQNPIEVGAGALTLTSYTPSVLATRNLEITTPTGALDITGYAPTLQQCRQYLCDAYETAISGAGTYWLLDDPTYDTAYPDSDNFRKNGSTEPDDTEPKLKREGTTPGSGTIANWTVAGYLDPCYGGGYKSYSAEDAGTNNNLYITPEPWPTDGLPRIRGSVAMANAGNEPNGIIAYSLRRARFSIGGGSTAVTTRFAAFHVDVNATRTRFWIRGDGANGSDTEIILPADFFDDGELHVIQWDAQLVFDGMYNIPASPDFNESGHVEGTIMIDGTTYFLESANNERWSGQSSVNSQFTYFVTGLGVNAQNELFRMDADLYGYSIYGPAELPDLYDKLQQNLVTYLDPNCQNLVDVGAGALTLTGYVPDVALTIGGWGGGAWEQSVWGH